MNNRTKSPVRVRRDRIVRNVERVLIGLAGAVFYGALLLGTWQALAVDEKPMRVEPAVARFEIPRGVSIPQPKAEHLRAYIEEGELAPAAETDAPVSLGWFNLTAYCPCSKCCGEYANGITATGTLATEGRTIAVDPRVIPYGTHVIINGHEYIAEDCGGGIKQNRIDVFFSSHEAALRFGVGEAEVFVVG